MVALPLPTRLRVLCAAAVVAMLVPPANSGTASARPVWPAGPAIVQAEQSWGYPLAGSPEVLRPFDGPAQPWEPGHRGVDFAAVVGQEVIAPREGVVSFSGPVAGRVVLTITHPDGLRSSFEALSDPVPRGTVVARGDVVARVATPHAGHCSSCLHWGVRRGETYIDPLSLLRRRFAVLLPWPEE